MVDTQKIILYVDDDADDQLLLLETVRELSVKVRVACAVNGVEALRFLERTKSDGKMTERPSLILMDINMPMMNGKEALLKIKNDPELKILPVVMFTTSSNAEDRAYCLEIGAADFVTKPFTREALEEIIKHCLTYMMA